MVLVLEEFIKREFMKTKIKFFIVTISIFGLGIFIGIRYDQYQDKSYMDDVIDKEVQEKIEYYDATLKWYSKLMRLENDSLREENLKLNKKLIGNINL